MNMMLFAFVLAVFSAAIVYLALEFMGGPAADEKSRIKRRLENLLENVRASTIDAKVTFSGIASINRALQRQRFSQQLNQLLIMSGVNMPLSLFLLLDGVWGVIIYFTVNIIYPQPIVSIPAGVIAAVIPYWYLIVKRRIYVQKFVSVFPEALMMMKNAIRAGQGIQPALQVVAKEGPQPVAKEFDRMVQEIELGSQMPEALNELYRRVPTLDLRIFVLGVFIQQEVGGNLAELFDHIEKTIRDRLSLGREVKVLSAQGKMTGIVLMLLPIFVAVALLGLDPTYYDPFFEEEGGRKIIWVAFGLQLIGGLIIRKITTFRTIF